MSGISQVLHPYMSLVSPASDGYLRKGPLDVWAGEILLVLFNYGNNFVN